MIMLDSNADSLQTDAPLADLGPLAWVFDELRKSLDAANKAIRRFVRENEQSRHGDLEAVDPAALRMARQQLHQAVGALEVVGLGAPAQVLREVFGRAQQPFLYRGSEIALVPPPTGWLPAGTIVFSGTPAGVIFRPLNLWNPWVYLRPGDEVIVAADFLGSIRNRIR